MSAEQIARPIYAARMPLPINAYAKISDALTVLHGEDIGMVGYGSYMVFFTAGDVCGCGYCSALIAACMETCDPGRDFSTAISNNPLNRMIVCATCGNKRCPHATNHTNDCTGSNKPGQEGSKYVVGRPEDGPCFERHGHPDPGYSCMAPKGHR